MVQTLDLQMDHGRTGHSYIHTPGRQLMTALTIHMLHRLGATAVRLESASVHEHCPDAARRRRPSQSRRQSALARLPSYCALLGLGLVSQGYCVSDRLLAPLDAVCEP